MAKAKKSSPAKNAKSAGSKGSKAKDKSIAAPVAVKPAKKGNEADEEAQQKATEVRASRSDKRITASSTAEYFSKNLQQVGFSSPTKAVLTTLKEALDNSLDACEEHGILPDLYVLVEKVGAGSMRNTDKIRVVVRDNGPGIDPDDVPKVFGEYLASSKFGRGRCTRGQQGIGISAATTWSQQTSGRGAVVVTKTKSMKKAFNARIEVDFKNNKGMIREKSMVDWKYDHGTQVEFEFDGRVQINGEAGLLNYIRGNILVNPHMTLTYQMPEMAEEVAKRVTNVVPQIPDATDPHPHTMKYGEFSSHAKLFGRIKVRAWLKRGFSRLGDAVIDELVKDRAINKDILEKNVDTLSDEHLKSTYSGIQNAKLMAPSTNSVLSIGEEGLAKSMDRLGNIDFFSVVSRKPCICDLKPVQVEVAIARLQESGTDAEDPVQVLRFANRVPLQFDKGACAIVKAISTVNWRAYGLRQPKDAIPQGPYIISVSVVSPFIKFKNASKETIDGSEELVEELRRALMQAGQRLSRHINRENKAAELEEKIQHIEKFGPILVETLCRITGATAARKQKAEDGLRKILGRDARSTEKELTKADERLEEAQAKDEKRLGKKSKGKASEEDEEDEQGEEDSES